MDPNINTQPLLRPMPSLSTQRVTNISRGKNVRELQVVAEELRCKPAWWERSTHRKQAIAELATVAVPDGLRQEVEDKACDSCAVDVFKTLKTGRNVCLIGGAGCGKTTTLKTVADC